LDNALISSIVIFQEEIYASIGAGFARKVGFTVDLPSGSFGLNGFDPVQALGNEKRLGGQLLYLVGQETIHDVVLEIEPVIQEKVLDHLGDLGPEEIGGNRPLDGYPDFYHAVCGVRRIWASIFRKI